MTLIEISIGLLILGLMMAAVVPSLRSITGADLRASVGQLAGAVRYMYGRSALTGQTCRLVMQLGAAARADLEEGEVAGAWWAECTESRVRLKKDARDEEEEEEVDEEDLSEADRAQREILKKAQFSSFTNGEIERVEMEGLGFESVWVAHQSGREAQTAGKAYLYFFPMGFTEDAIIAVSDGDDTVYSIKVRGLSGRVTVVKGKAEPPQS